MSRKGTYIIKLEDGETAYKTVNSSGNPLIQLLHAEPYTAPDLEQVIKEAYEKGFDAGRTLNADKYEKGLDDAWKCARKISSMDSKTRDEIFDRVITSSIVGENTASEAIEKIRAYEQGQEEIKVGDEVKAPFGKAIIFKIDNENDAYTYVYADGAWGWDHEENISKTGRHFPEIAEVLQKMKEAE